MPPLCAAQQRALPRLRRIFAGTPEQMYVSLNEKLATLPPDTQVLAPAWRCYLTLPYAGAYLAVLCIALRCWARVRLLFRTVCSCVRVFACR